MNREQVIRMAREADDWAENHLQCTGEYHPDFHDVRDERFAALVAAAERDACAQVCDRLAAEVDKYPSECADAIRARSSQ